jgi:GR25 family glycosyltransferase involved in LPS biosynthesis
MVGGMKFRGKSKTRRLRLTRRKSQRGGKSKNIKHAHVISLETSTDRFTELEKQAKAAGLELKRFSVVKPSYDIVANLETLLRLGGSTFINKLSLHTNPDLLGTLGCFISHRDLLGKILKEDSNKIALILEDDAIVPEDVLTKIDKIVDGLPQDWHLCFLGKNEVDSVPYSDNIAKLTNRFDSSKNYGTWAYLVHVPHIQLILKSLERISDALDTQYNYYTDRINTYLATPNIIGVNMEIKSTRF